MSRSEGNVPSNRARQALPSPSILAATMAATWFVAAASTAHAQEPHPAETAGGGAPMPSLDGSGNNAAHPELGAENTPYRRLGAANYADDPSEPADGPNARYLSNRIFADRAQNLFSENGVTP